MKREYPRNPDIPSGAAFRPWFRELIGDQPAFVVTMSMSGISEAKVRQICAERGVEFSPLMQAACEQAESADKANRDAFPSLEEQFAPYGGLDAFLQTYCNVRPNGEAQPAEGSSGNAIEA
ncbi:hypothetical protein [Planctomyces sp. SH-PL14]|uniref:hypothetical protein n=1 Tax=Planctomyces sp. SH-PL14 TaxID=1632864 RepID=UPI00078EE5AE|nr:hypothetical protein [Planctomyces sp. SH-PL14]AMV16937.1 hypothetical protein VT03_03545 [Planctomyces sp. SH-PL14]